MIEFGFQFLSIQSVLTNFFVIIFSSQSKLQKVIKSHSKINHNQTLVSQEVYLQDEFKEQNYERAGELQIIIGSLVEKSWVPKSQCFYCKFDFEAKLLR